MHQSPKIITLCTGLGIVCIVCISATYLNKPLSALTNQNNKTITSAPLIEIGNALYRLGKYNEAITYYDKALAINPNDVNALDYKGAALTKLGKYQDATTFLDKSLAINPKDNVASQTKIIALVLDKFQLIIIIVGIIICIITYVLTKRKRGRRTAFVYAIAVVIMFTVASFLVTYLPF
jgi:tetratricopeptide (TPR) repeat protein